MDGVAAAVTEVPAAPAASGPVPWWDDDEINRALAVAVPRQASIRLAGGVSVALAARLNEQEWTFEEVTRALMSLREPEDLVDALSKMTLWNRLKAVADLTLPVDVRRALLAAEVRITPHSARAVDWGAPAEWIARVQRAAGAISAAGLDRWNAGDSLRRRREQPVMRWVTRAARDVDALWLVLRAVDEGSERWVAWVRQWETVGFRMVPSIWENGPLGNPSGLLEISTWVALLQQWRGVPDAPLWWAAGWTPAEVTSLCELDADGVRYGRARDAARFLIAAGH